MCIIVFRPKGAKFPPLDTLQQCWTRNPDGGGLMYAKDGVLTIVKGLMTPAAMHAAVKEVPDDVPCALHFRIGTHGAKTAENTHPWKISDKIALVHNGILSGCGLAVNNAHSDSAGFAEKLAAMDEMWKPAYSGEWMKDPTIQFFILHALGFANKMVFLRASGEYWIANDKQGEWEDGCWYSNTSFRVYRTPPAGAYGGYGYRDADGEWVSTGGTSRYMGQRAVGAARREQPKMTRKERKAAVRAKLRAGRRPTEGTCPAYTIAKLELQEYSNADPDVEGVYVNGKTRTWTLSDFMANHNYYCYTKDMLAALESRFDEWFERLVPEDETTPLNDDTPTDVILLGGDGKPILPEQGDASKNLQVGHDLSIQGGGMPFEFE